MNIKIITIGSIAFATTVTSTFARPGRTHMGERPNPEDLVVEIVADYDANTDNVIDALELESAIVGIHEKRAARMKEMAEKHGVDSERHHREGLDGARQPPELSTVANRLLAEFDENGDSVLDTEELMGAVHALHSRGPGKRGPRGRGPSEGKPYSRESAE